MVADHSLRAILSVDSVNGEVREGLQAVLIDSSVAVGSGAAGHTKRLCNVSNGMFLSWATRSAT